MVTLKDIAERCNVSVGSVSKALNNDVSKNNWIGEKTRARIKKVALEMGYVADDMARSIKTGKSRIISYVMEGMAMDIFKGLTDVAKEHDYVIEPLYIDRKDPQHLKQLLNHIIKRRIAAVCICYTAPSANLLIERLKELKIPCALSAELKNHPQGIFSFDSNQEQGMILMADYLYSCGHRQLCYIGSGIKGGSPSSYRINIFKDTLDKKSAKTRVLEIIGDHEYQKRKIRKTMQAENLRPTAVCVQGPDSLVCVVTELYALGYRIPEDISIISYGDYSYATAMSCPVTSVKEKGYDQGALLAGKLVEMIESGKQIDARELCEVELVIRDSVKKI